MSHHDKGSVGRGHGGHRRGGHKPVVGGKAKEVLENINTDSPVIRAFLLYATALDNKHDRYERVVKISRDITIESKRIIFLLHTLDRDSKLDAILDEADKRLTALISGHFQAIAMELEGQDPYEYIRAYSAGLQEFIEASTFHHYLKDKTLAKWTDIEKQLKYVVKHVETNSTDDCKSLEVEGRLPVELEVRTVCTLVPPAEYMPTSTDDSKSLEVEGRLPVELEVRTVCTLVPPAEYILGLGDLTGELMRKCINSLGSGNIDGCYQTCAFVKHMYNGFLSIGNGGHKEIKRKLLTLKQSLAKMENACYMIHVRGSEIPKHMLADVFSGGLEGTQGEEDEGFY